eukprot:464929-Hanusia_phi.AAC.1
MAVRWRNAALSFPGKSLRTELTQRRMQGPRMIPGFPGSCLAQMLTNLLRDPIRVENKRHAEIQNNSDPAKQAERC